jgi:hypothetical protein
VQDVDWRDPSDLEAARSLLQARYDLKIGIWDLVGNPTLRRTLLDAIPSPGPSADSVAVPETAARRAEVLVATKVRAKQAEDQGLRTVANRLRPLEALGWERAHDKPWLFEFPMTEALPRYPDTELVHLRAPLVQLALTVRKHHSAVDVSTGHSIHDEIRSYVLSRKEVLHEIAAPDSSDLEMRSAPRVWLARGGWADDVDWAERLDALLGRTRRWVKTFQTLCEEETLRHATYLSRGLSMRTRKYLEMTVEQAQERLLALIDDHGGRVDVAIIEADSELARNELVVSSAARALIRKGDVIRGKPARGRAWFPYSYLMRPEADVDA